MIQVWKIVHGHDNVQEETWFTRKNKVSTMNTRLTSSMYNLELKPAKHDIRSHSFSVRVINRWNTLPDKIKESASLNSFKNSYDSYMGRRS